MLASSKDWSPLLCQLSPLLNLSDLIFNPFRTLYVSSIVSITLRPREFCNRDRETLKTKVLSISQRLSVKSGITSALIHIGHVGFFRHPAPQSRVIRGFLARKILADTNLALFITGTRFAPFSIREVSNEYRF
jgi:hypothetical protein